MDEGEPSALFGSSPSFVKRIFHPANAPASSAAFPKSVGANQPFQKSAIVRFGASATGPTKTAQCAPSTVAPAPIVSVPSKGSSSPGKGSGVAASSITSQREQKTAPSSASPPVE